MICFDGFEKIFTKELEELLNLVIEELEIKDFNEFPYNFLDILEKMFGKDNIVGLNPNSFYEIENWKEYLIKNKSIIIKITNLKKYLKLILRKRSLIIETTDVFGNRKRYNIGKNYPESEFRSLVFNLISIGTTDFKETTWFKNYKNNVNKKFNKNIFIKNFKKDLGIDISIEKVLENDDFKKVFLIRTPTGNILFDNFGNLIADMGVNSGIVSYTEKYLEELNKLGIEL